MTNPTTTEKSTLQHGQVLPNGATVVEAKVSESHLTSTGERAENGVVLARYGGEYVTWAYHIEGDRPVDTFWGHYIRDFKEAAEDFDRRR
jgi:hypothetical protein